MQEVWFRYDREEKDVIKGLSLSVKQGEFFCIVGGNGTGKTTTLSLISRLQQPYRGKIILAGKQLDSYSVQELFSGLLGVLPQNPQTLFVENTVKKDLLEVLSEGNWSKEEKEKQVIKVASLVEIETLLSRHPYDLSGGEQQRAALAKILLLEPRLLLLDEPTKGLDQQFKEKLARILKQLQDQGVTLIMVSHDIEFCAKYGDRCALFFDGGGLRR